MSKEEFQDEWEEKEQKCEKLGTCFNLARRAPDVALDHYDYRSDHQVRTDLR